MSLKKPFVARYDPYTQSIDILDKKEKIVRVVHSIQSQLETTVQALEHLEA